MLRFYLAAVITAIAFIISASGAATDSAPSAIAVVVGRDSFVIHVSRDDLRELYLRRQRVWPNGTRAIPINLPPDNPARQRFSTLVLGRAPQEMVSYWNARYFEGITPPVALPSAAAIRAYLKAEPAAIAYMPLEEVDDSCRTLLVLDH